MFKLERFLEGNEIEKDNRPFHIYHISSLLKKQMTYLRGCLSCLDADMPAS